MSLPLDYERRNHHLKILGYESYFHYLRSEMWESIRQIVLKRDNGKCIVCGRNAVDIHHNSYEMDVLIGKELNQLVSLCRYHHEHIEFDIFIKRDLLGAREALSNEGISIPELIRRPLPSCCIDEKEKQKPWTPRRKKCKLSTEEQKRVKQLRRIHYR